MHTIFDRPERNLAVEVAWRVERPFAGISHDDARRAAPFCLPQSGIGCELGRRGLENYLEIKQVTRFDNSRWGWYSK